MNHQINTSDVVHMIFPQLTCLNKILNVTERKVLKGTHLPMTIKEIQAGYLTNHYFKNIYFYLAQNALPSLEAARRQVKTQAQ